MEFNIINILVDGDLLTHLKATDNGSNSFILFGYREINRESLYVNILASIRVGQNCRSVKRLIKGPDSPQVLGILETSSSTSSQSILKSRIQTETARTFFVHLLYHDHVTINEILVTGKRDSTIPINLILYNSNHLLTYSINGPIGLDRFKEPSLKFCHQTIKRYSRRESADDSLIESFVSCFPMSTPEDSTPIEQSRPSRLKRLLDYTTTGSLMYHRLEESLFCINHLRNNHHTVKMLNIISLITFDLLLSFLFYLTLSQVTSPSNLLESCLQIMESIVSKVELLIYDLIGMPAGLKLNRPLNTALGNFFLYHIHIWRAYITLIRPFLSLILDLLGFISFFGITFVLGFFSDLISLASIHIYCFYGYAARLYSFQLSGLISLWRLFRGKKWNNLKHRVDSYSYGHDQLFIGTVCFTTLIFLLPTILLYYSVFLFLRLISIFSQLIIKLAIGVILSIPFYGITLWTMGSSKIQTNISFNILHVAPRRLTLQMTFNPMTLGQIFESHSRNRVNPFNYQKLLPINFIISILSGSLI